MVPPLQIMQAACRLLVSKYHVVPALRADGEACFIVKLDGMEHRFTFKEDCVFTPDHRFSVGVGDLVHHLIAACVTMPRDD